MALIRSRGNKDTELRLAGLLRKAHVTGWPRHVPAFGKPDFVFPQQRLAVFSDGCFWHGGLWCYRRPKSKQSYWDAKVERNRQRDRKVPAELRKIGWRVVRIWEHDLAKRPEQCISRLWQALQRGNGIEKTKKAN